MLDSRTYLERNITAEQAIRNFETKQNIRDIKFIYLKPVALLIVGLLMIIGLKLGGYLDLPKEKLNDAVDNFNDEIIIEMNSLVAGDE